jgi:hypothetical protein
MSLLARIFGRKSANPATGSNNVTSGWVADPSVPIRADLGLGRFCGVAPGAAIDALSHLGPCSKSPSASGDILSYPKLGMEFTLDEMGRFETVDMNLLAEADMAAFVGQWEYLGRVVTLNEGSTQQDIRRLLGAPESLDGNVAIYRQLGSCISFEWGDDGRLENVMLYGP